MRLNLSASIQVCLLATCFSLPWQIALAADTSTVASDSNVTAAASATSEVTDPNTASAAQALAEQAENYLRGRGVKRDMQKAVELYQQAAEQGNLKAQLDLAQMYSKGVGVPVDFRKSAKWYQKAYAQGSLEAQTSIGVLYMNGFGLPMDYAKAQELLDDSCQKQDKTACSFLQILQKQIARQQAAQSE